MNFGDFGARLLHQVMMRQVEADVAAFKDDGFKFCAARMAKESEQRLVALDHVYTGRLAQAFATVDQRDGILFVNVMPYAGDIEHGRPPGPVDFDAILEWTRVKLFGLPRRHNVGPIPFNGATPVKMKSRTLRSRAERTARASARGQDRGALEAEAAQAAKRIAAKLESTGTEPVMFFRDAHIAAPRHLTAWVRKNLPVAQRYSNFIGKVPVKQPPKNPGIDLSDIPF